MQSVCKMELMTVPAWPSVNKVSVTTAPSVSVTVPEFSTPGWGLPPMPHGPSRRPLSSVGGLFPILLSQCFLTSGAGRSKLRSLLNTLLIQGL